MSLQDMLERCHLVVALTFVTASHDPGVWQVNSPNVMLFSIALQDVVERFHLVMALASVLVEGYGSPLRTTH